MIVFHFQFNSLYTCLNFCQKRFNNESKRRYIHSIHHRTGNVRLSTLRYGLQYVTRRSDVYGTFWQMQYSHLGISAQTITHIVCKVHTVCACVYYSRHTQMGVNEVSFFTSLRSVDVLSPKTIWSRRENNTSRISCLFLLGKCFQFQTGCWSFWRQSLLGEIGPNMQLNTNIRGRAFQMNVIQMKVSLRVSDVL